LVEAPLVFSYFLLEKKVAKKIPLAVIELLFISGINAGDLIFSIERRAKRRRDSRTEPAFSESFLQVNK